MAASPWTGPERRPVALDRPVDVQVRILELEPERLPVDGARKFPRDRAPRSARVARDPGTESALREMGEPRPARPAEGRMPGWSARRLMRPSAPSSEPLRACREIAGDCSRSR